MVRVLLYALYAQEGIALTKGLFDVDEPDIWVKDLTGAIKLWIDIGQPDESRVRKACGRAEQVVVVCHASSCLVWWKQNAGKLARLKNLTVLRLPPQIVRAKKPMVFCPVRFGVRVTQLVPLANGSCQLTAAQL